MLTLECPDCGITRPLQQPEDLPQPGIVRILAHCPNCVGHGLAPAHFELADGRRLLPLPPLTSLLEGVHLG